MNANITYVPVAPNDLNEVAPVFSCGVDNIGISYLAGMLGLRAAQLFGVMERGNVTPEIAETMGKMDAYNFYIMTPSKPTIREKITDVSGNKQLGDKLLDIMLCKPEEDNMGETRNDFQVHPFETDKGIMSNVMKGGRHPIFRDNGNSLNYVHYYTKNGVGLVPSTVKDFGQYKEDFTYDGSSGNTYFTFTTNRNENVEKINNILYNCSDKTLFASRNEPTRYKKLIDYEKFNVLTKPSLVSGVLKRYEELNTGNFKIMGESYSEDFSKVLNRYWHVSESEFTSYLKNNRILRFKLKDTKVIDELVDVKQTSATKFNSLLNETNLPIKNENDSSWSVKGKEGSVSVDSLAIPLLKVYEDVGTTTKFDTLTGTNFYYLQNENELTEENNIVDKVKALLLLHSISQYHLNTTTLEAFKGDKTHASIQAIPYGLALLLGGLLWRRDFVIEKGKDPIIFSGKNGISYCSPKNKDGLRTEDPLLYKSGNNYFFMATKSNTKNFYNVKLSSLFGGSFPDYHVINALKTKFEEFVSGDWLTIK